MMTARNTRTARPSGGAGSWPLALLPIVVGVLAGLTATGLGELGTNWLIYLAAALAVGLAMPYAMRLAGGLTRALTILFFFSLPLSSGFNLIYKDVSNPSGYNGIRVTLVFLVAVAYAASRISREGWQHWGIHRRLVKATILFGLAGVASFINTTDRSLSVYGLV